MMGIIISKKDEASVNIGNQLLKNYEWKNEGGVLIHENKIIYFIEDLHLYHDNVDEEIKKLGYNVDTIIFASKHSSKSGKKTLSVHPIGNFTFAEYGGKDMELVKTNPLLMRNALQLLKEKNTMGYEVSYEATHHGPYLKTPTFFIEVGSTEKEWKNEKAGKIIADVIMEMKENSYDVAVGIGGGHYAPRFTDIALKNGIAFGHIAAKYSVPYLNDEMVEKMLAATPHCKKAYFHGKYLEVEKILERKGIEIG